MFLLNFCKDLDYDTNNGDKKSDRRKLILPLRSIREVKGRWLGIVFLSSDPKELVDRLNLLHPEKRAGNDSKIINEEIIAIVEKLYEYDCLTKEEHATFSKMELLEV